MKYMNRYKHFNNKIRHITKIWRMITACFFFLLLREKFDIKIIFWGDFFILSLVIFFMHKTSMYDEDGMGGRSLIRLVEILLSKNTVL